MSEQQDRQQIRDLIAIWIDASSKSDLDTVLTLMAEDAIFLRPGQPPMRGRKAFADAGRASQGQIRIEGKPDIQEILIAGDYAYCWNRLSITIFPTQEGATQKQLAGDVLTVFHRQPGGPWLLLRDANMLMPV